MHLYFKIALLTSFTQLSFAAWPVFITPDITFLRNNNLFEESNCPSGQSKIKSNTILNVHQNFCRTYCPTSWNWIINSAASCDDYKNSLIENVSVDHVQGADGNTSYSIVTAKFVDSISNEELFQFTMTTTPEEHWYCYVMNRELKLISCANDI